MILHEIKYLLYSQRNNYQSQETVQKIGDNMCQLYFRQVVNIQKTQRTAKLDTKKKNFQSMKLLMS